MAENATFTSSLFLSDQDNLVQASKLRTFSELTPTTKHCTINYVYNKLFYNLFYSMIFHANNMKYQGIKQVLRVCVLFHKQVGCWDLSDKNFGK